MEDEEEVPDRVEPEDEEVEPEVEAEVEGNFEAVALAPPVDESGKCCTFG